MEPWIVHTPTWWHTAITAAAIQSAAAEFAHEGPGNYDLNAAWAKYAELEVLMKQLKDELDMVEGDACNE